MRHALHFSMVLTSFGIVTPVFGAIALTVWFVIAASVGLYVSGLVFVASQVFKHSVLSDVIKYGSMLCAPLPIIVLWRALLPLAVGELQMALAMVYLVLTVLAWYSHVFLEFFDFRTRGPNKN